MSQALDKIMAKTAVFDAMIKNMVVKCRFVRRNGHAKNYVEYPSKLSLAGRKRYNFYIKKAIAAGYNVSGVFEVNEDDDDIQILAIGLSHNDLMAEFVNMNEKRQ